MKKRTTFFVLSTLLSTMALAHHSFATFAADKTVTLQGTVKEWQWTNPHTWLFLDVKNGANVDVWEIEGGPVVGLKRDGFSKDSFKVGDKVTVIIHPKRDGSHGGAFVQAITADGKTLGRADQQITTATPKDSK
jgi:hypothetical protein